MNMTLAIPTLKKWELLFPQKANPTEKELSELEKMQSNATKVRRNVDVVYGHGGCGKTHKIFKDWQNMPDVRKLYLSHSHSYLKEQSERVSGSRHIIGFSKLCDAQFIEPKIGKLIKAGFPKKVICRVCRDLCIVDRNDCRYKQQFCDLPDTVMAPVEYAFTKFITKQYEPDIIVVDDCLLKMHTYSTTAQLQEMLNFFF